MSIDINLHFQQVIDAVNSGEDIFVTGKAGTGKSTLLRHLQTTLDKKMVVLAPTGVAAINIGGQTIHSFFGFMPDVNIQKIYRKHEKNEETVYNQLDILVIDEISMVRADLLDCVDQFMRLHGKKPNTPFGGVQLVFIGDLYQLPPVVPRYQKELFTSQYASPYFFSAPGFSQIDMHIIELEKVYRQKDDQFVHALNAIRNRSCGPQDLALINRCVDTTFVPKVDDLYITLTTTNALSDEINDRSLALLDGDEKTFEAFIVGSVEKGYYPTQEELTIKVGSQVMLLNNDQQGRWVNGSIGRVMGFDQGEYGEVVEVLLETGNLVEVGRHTWEVFSYALEGGQVTSEVVGEFTQYPLRLAFAITIHKSQGKTFDNVIIDIGKGTFAHGQMYVALSRCTSLEGLVLRQEILPKNIQLDPLVTKFLTSYVSGQSLTIQSLQECKDLLNEAVINGKTVGLVYRTGSDDEVTHTVHPRYIGMMEFRGNEYEGMIAYSPAHGSERIYSLKRVISVELIDDDSVGSML